MLATSMIHDDDVLIWWAAGGYPLVCRSTHWPKARARRERKRIFRSRGWPATTNDDLDGYRDAILKGALLSDLA